jgi:hypothetical protein
MLGKVRYRRRVVRSLTEAQATLHANFEAAVADERMRALLDMTAYMQADVLQEFAVEQRDEREIPGFVAAMPDPAAAVRALRLATWALVLGIPRSRLGRRCGRSSWT